MIVVTGAAGFIGSCLIQKLNEHGFKAVIAVDAFDRLDKNKNLDGKSIWQKIERDNFFAWLDEQFEEVEFIFHLGARTDTAETDRKVLWPLNTDFSKKVWDRCVRYQIPLVYASSAATYGNGEFGYNDDLATIQQLKPLNAYGASKHEFDQWVLQQDRQPFYWAGLKFFNVYGPNEYHKSRMASVVYHAYHQVCQTGKMRLFKSHDPRIADGEQMRDFVYVKDVINVCYFLMRHRKDSGIYNLGSGQARSFLDLTRAVFKAMGQPEVIEFIDIPKDIRMNYQYYTQAEMQKLMDLGYSQRFHSLEAGISDYVLNYLVKDSYL